MNKQDQIIFNIAIIIVSVVAVVIVVCGTVSNREVTKNTVEARCEP